MFRLLQYVLLWLCFLELPVLYGKEQEILILLNLESQRPIQQSLSFQLNHPFSRIWQGYEIPCSYVIATLSPIYNSVDYRIFHLCVVGLEKLLSAG